MALKYLNNISLENNELQNARIHNLGSAPSTAAGKIYFDTSDNKLKFHNGTTWVIPEQNTVVAVNGTAPIQVSGTTTRTISIDPASGSTAGSMSISHYNLVAGAVSTNTNSTLVLRDGSGNFSAGTITAALTGTASNASNLNNQAASFYLDRTNHTGTQLAATISNFDTQVRTSRLDQMAVPTADVSLNSRKLTNVADPVNPQDAATKAYVDAARAGLDVKPSVRAASTGNVTVTYNATGGASGRGQITAVTNSIDGVTLVNGDRVLLKDQSTGAQNGIWIVTTAGTGANGVWDRGPQFDNDAEVTSGAFTFVEEGTVNADSGWVLTTNNPITIGGASGTSLAFAQFSGAGQITAGNGLTKTGNTLDVGGTTNRITVAADTVDIAATYVGQTSITTLGTITTGTWNGTTIAVANGGTGRASNTAYMPLVGGTTTTGAHQSVATGSTTGQALTYQGAAAVPTFAAINLAGGANIVTGTLPVGNGGSGAATFTSNGVLLGNGASAFAVTAAGGANSVLRVPSGGGAPAFGAVDIASAMVTGVLPIANGGSNATAANYTTGKFLVYDGTRLTSSIYDQTSFATAGHTHVASAAKYATAIGDGSSVNFTVTHNLGSQDVVIEVAEAATPWAKVYPDIEHTSTTTATIRFAVAPTAGQYRVTVIG